MKYEFFEHTADAKFRAYGKNLDECFKNAALAMFSIMVDSKKIDAKIKKKITIEGSDLKSLLYNFLEKLIYLLDVEFFVLKKVSSLKIKGNVLEAVIEGQKVPKNVELGCEVKAVTYNSMIIKNKEPYMVQVVLDL